MWHTTIHNYYRPININDSFKYSFIYNQLCVQHREIFIVQVVNSGIMLITWLMTFKSTPMLNITKNFLYIREMNNHKHLYGLQDVIKNVNSFDSVNYIKISLVICYNPQFINGYWEYFSVIKYTFVLFYYQIFYLSLPFKNGHRRFSSKTSAMLITLYS